MRYLVTGGAGFIGRPLADALLARGDEVVCVDNFNDYYSPARKRRNIEGALAQPGYTLIEADFRDLAAMEHIFETNGPPRSRILEPWPARARRSSGRCCMKRSMCAAQ